MKIGPGRSRWSRRGDRIVFVGSDEEALEHAAEDARLVNLQHRFVMPGMVDAHTHPGLIATGANLSVLDETDEADEGPAKADRDAFPAERGDAGLAAAVRGRPPVHPRDPTGGVGRRHLPAPRAAQERPGCYFQTQTHHAERQFGGTASWVNSAFLRLFGIDADTPDLSRNLSHFVRDENGEPTGWVKEFSLLPYFR